MVAGTLAHLGAAVRPRQAFAHDDGDLRTLTQSFLQFASRYQDVEQLILPAHLHIRLLSDSIIRLHQGVEELVQVDRLPGVHTLAEILTHEELLHREVGRQPDDVGEIQAGQPFIVVADARQVRVEDFERLFRIGTGILAHFIAGELRARLVLVRRVSDQAGECANEKGDIVPELLKLAQLTHGDRMPQVQVRRARVIAAVDAQRTSLFLSFDQPFAQFARHRLFRLRVAVFSARHQYLYLFVNRRHGWLIFTVRG